MSHNATQIVTIKSSSNMNSIFHMSELQILLLEYPTIIFFFFKKNHLTRTAT